MSDLDNGHWQYPEPINPDNWFGFVYRIVEINTGKEYIGKKQFWSVRRKVVKNRKNRKKVISPSNWKKYTSSSKHLNNAIDEFGKENYAFFIESLHDTKASLFYAEVERQVKDNVLRETLSNGEKKFYNKCIAGVKFIPPAESNNEAYANINNYEIMTEWCESMMAHEGENNSMWGKTSPKKGLSFEEYYGRDRAENIKNKLREHNLGKKSPMKGVKMHSDEQIKKWRNDERRKHVGESNGMYGKPCHFNMSEEEKERWKKNVGDGIRGIKRTEETKKKMSKASAGRKYEKVECPHCKKVGAGGNMTRYHFDNCKKK